VGQNAVTELVVKCGCGFEARGVEEELVLIAEEHAIEAHNVFMTEGQVLASLHPTLPSRSRREPGLR
jgi:hypothetical protein